MATILDFLRAPKHQRYIAAEAFFWLIGSMLLVRFVPFRLWARWLGETGITTPEIDQPKTQFTLRRVTWAVEGASAYLPWKSTCLMNALAGKRLLRRRGIASTVYLGARRDHDAPQTRLAAHAWLRVGSRVILGADQAAEYHPVAWFGDRP